MLLLAASACTGVDWQGRSNLRLREYQEAFAEDCGHFVDGGASLADFEALVRTRRALWLGDHHRDERLHAHHRELLQRLFRARPCVLLLEAVGSEDQPALDDYLAGRIALERTTAIVAARWPDSWLSSPEVDAPHYRELLALARATRTPVHGLEPAPRLPLAERDVHMAARTRAVAAAHPHRLVVVVVGQAHLLGQGRVPERTGLPSVLVGAEAPNALATRLPWRGPHDLARTERGLWFFLEPRAR